MLVGPPVPINRQSFGGQSQYITSVAFVSSDTSCIGSTNVQTEQNFVEGYVELENSQHRSGLQLSEAKSVRKAWRVAQPSAEHNRV
jgi:hypothetical protein